MLCLNCEHFFKPSRPNQNQKFCNKKCRDAFWQKQNKTNDDKSWRDELSTGTIGAISEMIVCADLLRKGFDVFRAVSPSCPCDLVILLKNGEMRRIEVRTAYRTKSSEEVKCVQNGEYDVLAKVLIEEDRVIYHPEI